MTTISDAAIDLIIREEISSEAYYTQKYQHLDWPEGDSGPTVGIGYDLGYVKPDELRADWDGIVDTNTIEAMRRAVGIKGVSARDYVRAHKTDVTIPYTPAIRQFREREVPKWIARTVAPLPNADHLSPDSLGALVSLAYNRGASFKAPGERYAEMREIHACMQRGDFGAIPACIRRMKRLWGSDTGLPGRREREAQLFEKGLAACIPLNVVTVEPAPETGPAPEPETARSHEERLPDIATDAVAHETAATPKSATGLAFMASIAMFSRTVWSAIMLAWLTVGDALNHVLGLLPEIKTEVDGSMSAVDSFTSAFKVNKEAIAAVLVCACVATIVFRHTRDKAALIKKDAGHAGDSGDGGAGARA